MKKSFKGPESTKPQATKKIECWSVLGIFTLALVIRLVYLWEISDSPAFYTPIIDSGTYHRLASQLAIDQTFAPNFFSQAFFYPAFLSAVYYVTGVSINYALIVQAVMGSLLCVLVFFLGKKLFGKTPGIFAGLIVATYGPLVFFGGQLLSTCLTSIYPILILYLLLHAAEKHQRRVCFICGVTASLSVITHGVFMPFAIVAGLWLVWTLSRLSRGTFWVFQRGFAWTLGFVLIILVASFLTKSVTGRFSPVQETGFLNIYIGNNPDNPECSGVRPGFSWEALFAKAQRDGAKTMKEMQQYFKAYVLEYVVTQPRMFLYGLMNKSVQFISSREIPNTYDPYTYREWSCVLKMLLWKINGFGFPFGVLFPIALYGIITSFRRVPTIFLLLLVIYPLSIILVFVSARFRIPIIPVLALFFGVGLATLVETVKKKDWFRLTRVLFLLVSVGFLCSIAGPFGAERYNYVAEMHACLAWDLQSEKRYDEAEEHYHKALSLSPDYGQAHFNLGRLLIETDQPRPAIEHLTTVLKINPNRHMTHFNLGNAYLLLNDARTAANHYAKELEYDPNNIKAHLNLGIALKMQGLLKQAKHQYCRALSLSLDNTELRPSVLMFYAFFFGKAPSESSGKPVQCPPDVF